MNRISKKLVSMIMALTLMLGNIPTVIMAENIKSSPWLTAIEIDQGNMQPSFSMDVTEYTITVENEESAITVLPKWEDGTEVSMQLVPASRGIGRTYDLYVGNTMINIDTKHQDGEEGRRYTLNVIRKDSNKLRGLSVAYESDGDKSALKLNPSFDADITEYEIAVPQGVTEIFLNPSLSFEETDTPWLIENHQKVMINGNTATVNQSNEIEIFQDHNRITVVVYPELGEERTYYINAIRESDLFEAGFYEEFQTEASEESNTIEDNKIYDEMDTNIQFHEISQENDDFSTVEEEYYTEIPQESDFTMEMRNYAEPTSNETPELTELSLISATGQDLGSIDFSQGTYDYLLELNYSPNQNDRIAKLSAKADDGLQVKINGIPANMRTYRLEQGEQSFEIEVLNPEGEANIYTIAVIMQEAVNLLDANIANMIETAKNYYTGYKQYKLDSWWDLGAAMSSGISLEEFSYPDYTGDFTGTQATQYTGRILGEIAVGNNPYKTLSGQNLVKDMIDKFQDDHGSFGTLMNQHMWSIIALNAANAEVIYNESNPSKKYEKEKAVKILLNKQNAATGAFDSLDLTAMAMIALAGSKEIDGVEEAIDKALEYFKNTQVKTGKYAGGWGENNSNTLASAISGLASVGEDLTSEKWTVDGVNPLMVLKMYQIGDKTTTGYGGFRYTETGGINPMASYQSIIALGDAYAKESVWTRIQYTGTMDDEPYITKAQLDSEIATAQLINKALYTDESYKVLEEKLNAAKSVSMDAVANQVKIRNAYTNLVAARGALVKKSTTGPGTGDDTIYVSFEIRGDRKMGTIFKGTMDNLPEDSTVFDVLVMICHTKNMDLKYNSQYGTPYVEGINGLNAFDNGPNSGWMYNVNRKEPDVGCGDYILSNGDSVQWTYTDDYTKGNDYWHPVKTTSTSQSGDTYQYSSETNITASKGDTGIATATIAGTNLDEFIYTVLNFADEKDSAVKLNVALPENALGIKFTIPSEAVKAFANKKNTGLLIGTDMGDVLLDAKTILNIIKTAGSNDVILSLTKANAESLREDYKSLVGDKPVYEITIAIKDQTIKTFDEGKIHITFPYTLAEGEEAENLNIYYLPSDNTEFEIYETKYNEEAETISFTTDHLSTFAMVYTELTDINVETDVEDILKGFNDISKDHFAKEYIDYLFEKGMIAGVGDNNFAPEREIKRSEFAAILAKISGDDLSDTNSGFEDVSENTWFAPFVTWIRKTGITSGTSETTFSPNAYITKQEIAVMIVNYIQYKGVTIEEINQEINQEIIFTDSDLIADYAKNAVYMMQKTGIMDVSGNEMFLPNQSVTRGEAAMVLAKVLMFEE